MYVVAAQKLRSSCCAEVKQETNAPSSMLALIVSARQCGLQSTLLDLIVQKHALLADAATTMDMPMPTLVPESGSARQTCFGIWTHTT